MVLKEVNWVHIGKIRSNGLERSQFGVECKNQVNMDLKGVNWANWVYNVKISSYGLERSHLGTH